MEKENVKALPTQVKCSLDLQTYVWHPEKEA